jgi:ADP-ribose pyrophosphatase YjhB (NUDIX family)
MSDIKVHSSIKSLENTRFDVFFDSLEDERGNKIPEYLVVSPKVKSQNLISGIGILPIFRNKIGLIRVYRHPVGEEMWELPRGFIDEKETAENSAIRELKEETGLDTSRENLESLGYIIPDGGIFRARIQLFAAQCSGLPSLQISSEFGHKKLQFFEMPEIAEMANQSQIQDPSTLVAFYRYLARQTRDSQVYP